MTDSRKGYLVGIARGELESMPLYCRTHSGCLYFFPPFFQSDEDFPRLGGLETSCCLLRERILPALELACGASLG